MTPPNRAFPFLPEDLIGVKEEVSPLDVPSAHCAHINIIDVLAVDRRETFEVLAGMSATGEDDDEDEPYAEVDQESLVKSLYHTAVPSHELEEK